MTPVASVTTEDGSEAIWWLLRSLIEAVEDANSASKQFYSAVHVTPNGSTPHTYAASYVVYVSNTNDHFGSHL